MSSRVVGYDPGTMFFQVAEMSRLDRHMSLVVLQHDNYGFSVPVVFRSKAQCEGNGHPLVEHWNAAAGHHRDAESVIITLIEH